MIAQNGADQSAGIGFAIPINTAKAVLDDFINYGHALRPSLDIVSLPIGPDVAEQIGLAADSGILIQRVVPGGAADLPALTAAPKRPTSATPHHAWRRLDRRLDGQQVATPPTCRKSSTAIAPETKSPSPSTAAANASTSLSPWARPATFKPSFRIRFSSEC